MTRLIVKLGSLAVTALLTTAVFAEPTTAPATAVPATTRQLIVEVPSHYASVLVLPFSPVSGSSDWIGKAVQEDLGTELVKQTRLSVVTPANSEPAADLDAATKIGHDHNVSLVAFGTYQVVDSQVRLNGQVVDVLAGRAIAALKATGERRDLFRMEDLLAGQVVAVLPPEAIKVGGGAYASDTPAVSRYTEPYNSQGFYVTPGPDIQPIYNSYTYNYAAAPDYAYPPYSSGYDYPLYGSGFIFLGGFGHGHDHDGDRGHGHFGGRGTTINGPRSLGSGFNRGFSVFPNGGFSAFPHTGPGLGLNTGRR
jgi:TolB-like protein